MIFYPTNRLRFLFYNVLYIVLYNIYYIHTFNIIIYIFNSKLLELGGVIGQRLIFIRDNRFKGHHHGVNSILLKYYAGRVFFIITTMIV